MKKIMCVIALAMIYSGLQAGEAKAQNAFGHSGIVYDSANRVVRGYSRTEVDYQTAAYYSPYVCGSLIWKIRHPSNWMSLRRSYLEAMQFTMSTRRSFPQAMAGVFVPDLSSATASRTHDCLRLRESAIG